MCPKKKEEIEVSRRAFLNKTAVSLAGVAFMSELGCLHAKGKTAKSPTSQKTKKAPAKKAPVKKVCAQTEDNIEGPFYCSGAPWRTKLADAKTPGTPLSISGRVLQPDCSTPLVGAQIEIWHADIHGQYDNTCQTRNKSKSKYSFRGTMKTNANGEYAYDTIIPGRYLNGPQYRPAHIHYRVNAPGYQELITQLYFKGDPYNTVDGFIKASLIIPLQAKGKGKKGVFDIVLKKR